MKSALQLMARWGLDLSSHPVKVLILSAIIICLRWLWIAGLGEYGITYESAHRIAQGQIPYRDFILVVPPVTSYTLAGFLKLGNYSLWAENIHFYFSWLLTLLAGVILLKELGVPRSASMASVALSIGLSIPIATNGNAYSYFGPAFAATTIIFLLRFARTQSLGDLCIAGLIAGFTIWVKQNVGLAICVTGAIATLFYAWHLRQSLIAAIYWTITFGFTVVLGFLVPFLYFAIPANAGEVFQETFLDAAAGKAGAYGVMVRAIPRINAYFLLPNRRFLEISASLIAYLSLAIVGIREIRRTQSLKNQHLDSQATTATIKQYQELNQQFCAPCEEHLRNLSKRLGQITLGTLLLMSIFSLGDFAIIRSFYAYTKLDTWRNNFLLLNNITLIALFTFTAIIVYRSLRQGDYPTLLLGFYALMLTVGTITSNQDFFSYTAPVSLPLFLALAQRNHLLALFLRSSLVLVPLLLIFVHNTSFVPLQPLPANSPFARLYAPAAYATQVNELWHNVTPKIRGRDTLWLTYYGPHSAYQGKPVMNFAQLYGDLISPRTENILKTTWEAHPPDFLVLANFWRQDEFDFFAASKLRSWVAQRYDLIWQGTVSEMTLWRRKGLETK
jgi:hypothetical protein